MSQDYALAPIDLAELWMGTMYIGPTGRRVRHHSNRPMFGNRSALRGTQGATVCGAAVPIPKAGTTGHIARSGPQSRQSINVPQALVAAGGSDHVGILRDVCACARAVRLGVLPVVYRLFNNCRQRVLALPQIDEEGDSERFI